MHSDYTLSYLFIDFNLCWFNKKQKLFNKYCAESLIFKQIMYIKNIIYFFHYKIHSGHDLYNLLR